MSDKQINPSIKEAENSSNLTNIPPGLIQKIKQQFDDMDLFLDSEILCVVDILPMYLELNDILVDLRKYISLKNEDIDVVRNGYLNLKNNRKAADILSEEEKSKMKIDLGDVYSSITKQLDQLKSPK